MCVLGAVRESRIFRPVLPASGSLSARGEILDHKTSAQHKFLGVKINLDPGFGIRYDRFIRALMNS